MLDGRIELVSTTLLFATNDKPVEWISLTAARCGCQWSGSAAGPA
jgi:hypothetical protein